MTDKLLTSAENLALYKLSTDSRPLRLMLDNEDSSGNASLLPQRVIGSEAVCGGFEFQILCVSERATLPLKDFIGMPAELQVVTDRGQLRRICGIVTEAASGQSDGGLATYQLIMHDALSVMESKINTRVFREKNELDIIQLLVAEWRKSMPVLAAFDLYIDVSLASRQSPVAQASVHYAVQRVGCGLHPPVDAANRYRLVLPSKLDDRNGFLPQPEDAQHRPHPGPVRRQRSARPEHSWLRALSP